MKSESVVISLINPLPEDKSPKKKINQNNSLKSILLISEIKFKVISVWHPRVCLKLWGCEIFIREII